MKAMSEMGSVIDQNVVLNCFYDSANVETYGKPKTIQNVIYADNNKIYESEYKNRMYHSNIQLIPDVVLDGANY